jgi:hypothetical protein
MCCIGNAAWAANEIGIVSEGKSGYLSDPIEITNWEDLQKELIDAYGGEVYVTSAIMELQDFDDNETPKAYLFQMNGIVVFSIINQPTPSEVGNKILNLFSDFQKSDLKTDDQGGTILSQSNNKGGHTLMATLLKSSENSNSTSNTTGLTSLKIDSNVTIGFPLGSEVVTDNTQSASGVKVRSFGVEVPLSPQDAVTLLTTELANANIIFQETGSTVAFQTKEVGAGVGVSLYDESKQTSLILFNIYSKN